MAPVPRARHGGRAGVCAELVVQDLVLTPGAVAAVDRHLPAAGAALGMRGPFIAASVVRVTADRAMATQRDTNPDVPSPVSPGTAPRATLRERAARRQSRSRRARRGRHRSRHRTAGARRRTTSQPAASPATTAAAASTAGLVPGVIVDDAASKQATGQDDGGHDEPRPVAHGPGHRCAEAVGPGGGHAAQARVGRREATDDGRGDDGLRARARAGRRRRARHLHDQHEHERRPRRTARRPRPHHVEGRSRPRCAPTPSPSAVSARPSRWSARVSQGEHGDGERGRQTRLVIDLADRGRARRPPGARAAAPPRGQEHRAPRDPAVHGRGGATGSTVSVPTASRTESPQVTPRTLGHVTSACGPLPRRRPRRNATLRLVERRHLGERRLSGAQHGQGHERAGALAEPQPEVHDRRRAAAGRARPSGRARSIGGRRATTGSCGSRSARPPGPLRTTRRRRAAPAYAARRPARGSPVDRRDVRAAARRQQRDHVADERAATSRRVPDGRGLAHPGAVVDAGPAADHARRRRCAVRTAISVAAGVVLPMPMSPGIRRSAPASISSSAIVHAGLERLLGLVAGQRRSDREVVAAAAHLERGDGVAGRPPPSSAQSTSTADVDDAHGRAVRLGEDVHRGAAGEEVEHHLRGDLGRVGAHAGLGDAVVAGEHHDA